MKKCYALLSIFVLIGAVYAVPPVSRVFYSAYGNSKYNGEPIPAGASLLAYDKDSVLCGNTTVERAGEFAITCVGDDTATTQDEGASPGDTITFTINGDRATVTGGSAEWQSGWQELNIEATTGCSSDADCSSSADSCNTGKCSLQTGKCYAQQKADGTVCESSSCSGLLFNPADTCQAGQCTVQGSTDCSSQADECNTAVCNAASGCSKSPKTGTDCGICSSCNSAGVCSFDSTQSATDCSSTSCSDSCNKDSKPYTFDYADDVQNECESKGKCTERLCTYTSQCRDNNDDAVDADSNKCSAACDQNSDCDDGNPATVDTCKSDCSCSNAQEICNNGIDDDSNSKIDCADPACAVQEGPGGAICCQASTDCSSLNAPCAAATCSASKTCVQNYKPSSTQCRGTAGSCDVAEYCTGTSKDCPTDQFKASTYVCRNVVGLGDQCDIEEKCTGNSASCPEDAVKPSSTICRAPFNDCDLAEYCDGTGKYCPNDAKALEGTLCGSARDCQEDRCIGNYAAYYADDGHDTCNGFGKCEPYSCSSEGNFCSDDDPNDGINGLLCGAECDQNSDCQKNTCTQAYNDYCSEGKLIEYDTDKTMDSTTVSDSCDNNCEACGCTDCETDCSAPQANTYCIPGICGAVCGSNDDCADTDPNTIDICSANCACLHVKEDCSNGIDDDNNGLADCADPICLSQTGPGGSKCCGSSSDCSSLSNDCAAGVCSTNNECTAEYQPLGTDCGTCAECNGQGTCTYDETEDNECESCKECAGINSCVNQQEGSDIKNDCSADGRCKLDTCNGDGACAVQPQGEVCGACASCDSSGTCIYDSTKNSQCQCPADTCTDNNGDCIADAYKDNPEGECKSVFECKACGSPTVSEPDTRCLTSMKVPLEAGVSMFSLPLQATNSFNSMQEGCAFTAQFANNGIAYWNPASTAQNKYAYLNGDSGLQPGQGYFTTQQNDCSLNVEGYQVSSSCIGNLGTNKLQVGWNMIGAPSEPVADINKIKGTCRLLSGPYGFNSDKYEYFRTQRLEPGKGYFVQSATNCAFI